MVILVKTKVLSVGIGQQAQALQDLPIRLLNLSRGEQAVSAFKREQIDSVISHWHLADMPDGQFLKKLKAVYPNMPTIALIEAGNTRQEIAARSLGVAAVIPEDSDGDYLREVVSMVLGLQTVQIEQVYAIDELNTVL
jgi:DNA-binding NarL/FixJ family response regulator